MKLQFSIRTLLLVVPLICVACLIVRARYFPPTISVDVVAPGQYQIDGRDVKMDELKQLLSKFKSDKSNSEMWVVLPPRPHSVEYDPDISDLTKIGGESGFKSVAFARRSGD